MIKGNENVTELNIRSVKKGPILSHTPPSLKMTDINSSNNSTNDASSDESPPATVASRE